MKCSGGNVGMMLQRTQVEKGAGLGCERTHETEEGRRAFAAMLTEKLERVASRAEVEVKLQQCLRDLPDLATAADLKKKAAAQTAAAIQKHTELEGDEGGSILDAHMNHINWDDSKKATPTALRSPGPPQPFPFPLHFRQPRSSRSPDPWHSSPSVAAPAPIPPPPMTSSYPSPFPNSSALIKPLSSRSKNPAASSGSPALQRHRASAAAAEAAKASPNPFKPGPGPQQRIPPHMATLLNRASDTSGIESGSSSNPSLVSAFFPAPPSLPATATASLHRQPKAPSAAPAPSSTPAASASATGPRRSRNGPSALMSGSLNRNLSRGRRSEAGPPPTLFGPQPGHLVLVYSLPDEEVPYAVSVPANPALAAPTLTLKDVKSKLPKKNQDSREFK